MKTHILSLKTIKALFMLIAIVFMSLSIFSSSSYAAEDTSMEESYGLEVTAATAVTPSTLRIFFSATPFLAENVDIAALLSITNSESEELLVHSGRVIAEENALELTTDSQVAGEVYSVTVFSSLTDIDGNAVFSGFMDTVEFVGAEAIVVESVEETVPDQEESLHAAAEEEVEADTTAPEDVTDLQAAYVLNENQENYTVNLDWTASANTAEDLDHMNYYEKDSLSDYSTAIQVEKDKTSYQRVLEGGERYTFKISTVDATGNESAGAIASIILPETGPAALLAVAGLLSAGAAHMLRRRR